MNNKPQIKILGYLITTSIDKLDLRGSRILVNTINPYSYCISKKDKLFHEALLNTDVLVPDGIGIVMADRLLKKGSVNRITGSDLHEFLLKKLNEISGKVFYLGASSSTLKKIEDRLAKEYPKIEFDGYSPPYKAEFSAEENNEMIAAVNDFQPHVVFVGMTAPKQEKWAYQHKEQLNTNIIVSIGAAFDFYGGTVKRSPKWLQNIGLEWFFRLIQEPKRMWKRCVVTSTLFFYDIFRELIKKRENII